MKTRLVYSLIKKRPAHVILHVTDRCTFRCKTCFVAFSETSKEITIEDIGKISRFVGKILWLDVSGGEPFLREDLPEICTLFDTKLISIPTNGFNPELICKTVNNIRRLTSCDLNICVSIDGFEKTHDEIRSHGSYRTAIETIKLLKTIRGIKVKVNTVVCERNCDELVDLMKYIKELSTDFHSIVFLRGNPRDSRYRLPSYENLKGIKKDIFNAWAAYDYGIPPLYGRVLRSYQRTMYDTSLKILKEKKQIPSCLAWKKHLVVYANGDIAFCEMLSPFGNIHAKPIEILFQSKLALQQKELIKGHSCFCHHNCNLLDNFFLNPSQYLNLVRGILAN